MTGGVRSAGINWTRRRSAACGGTASAPRSRLTSPHSSGDLLRRASSISNPRSLGASHITLVGAIIPTLTRADIFSDVGRALNTTQTQTVYAIPVHRPRQKLGKRHYRIDGSQHSVIGVHFRAKSRTPTSMSASSYSVEAFCKQARNGFRR